jgi:acrylyl-CoA reductase (NADPH)
MERRKLAWQRLARDLELRTLDDMIETATLEELPRLSGAILTGQVRGRVVVDPTD